MEFAVEIATCGTGVQAGLATMLLLVWSHSNEQVHIAEQIIYLTLVSACVSLYRNGDIGGQTTGVFVLALCCKTKEN